RLRQEQLSSVGFRAGGSRACRSPSHERSWIPCMIQFLLICLGGAVGTGARYLFGGWAQRTWGSGFPYGTLGVNMLGSFLIVILMQLGLVKGAISADLRVILTTGVMGGFTTYSTFNFETLQLLREGSL